MLTVSKKLALVAATLLAFTASPGRASIITFTPPDADMGDLDHTLAYTWKINTASFIME